MDMNPGKQDDLVEEIGPSVLSLIIDKHEAIETVSLIKRELTQEIIPNLTPEKHCKSATEGGSKPKSDEEFKGLTSLLENSKIQSVIKGVAGNDTQDIIDKALVALKSSESVDDKSKVFKEGIKKLHANLTLGEKSKLQNDPLFNLAIGLVGLRQDRKI